uniref:T9SS type A sorting domain-containing protein n=1 Tax=Fluviicola taffensis TaxID=191579 RepID=UPI0031377AFF
PSTSTLSETECGSYTWHGTTYSTSGAYTWTGTNAAGCDSIVTLNLTITQPSTSTLSETECGSYSWHGTTYTTSGAYTWTGTNAAGCDSIVTLNLTITQPSTSTLSETECGSYTWHGTTYTTSGAYTWTGTNAAGCDSIVTLNLTITQPSTSTLSETECGSYTWHGTTYTTSGSYTWTGTNAAGCDSIVTLNLTIQSVNVSVTVQGATMTSGEAGGTYQWVKCDGSFTAISGATSQTYTPTSNGSYAVIVTGANGCADTSACVNITNVGLESLSFGAELKAYPNPTLGNVKIDLGETQHDITLTVRDALGRIVEQYQYEEIQSIDLNMPEARGVYSLTLTTQEGRSAILQIVKQ